MQLRAYMVNRGNPVRAAKRQQGGLVRVWGMSTNQRTNVGLRNIHVNGRLSALESHVSRSVCWPFVGTRGGGVGRDVSCTPDPFCLVWSPEPRLWLPSPSVVVSLSPERVQLPHPRSYKSTMRTFLASNYWGL